eukprot:PhM_4_TR2739/c0_g2_i1/m.52339
MSFFDTVLSPFRSTPTKPVKRSAAEDRTPERKSDAPPREMPQLNFENGTSTPPRPSTARRQKESLLESAHEAGEDVLPHAYERRNAHFESATNASFLWRVADNLHPERTFLPEEQRVPDIPPPPMPRPDEHRTYTPNLTRTDWNSGHQPKPPTKVSRSKHPNGMNNSKRENCVIRSARVASNAETARTLRRQDKLIWDPEPEHIDLRSAERESAPQTKSIGTSVRLLPVSKKPPVEIAPIRFAATTIGTRELQLVQDTEAYANDAIIDFYLRFLKVRFPQPRVHTFHSQFHTTLRQRTFPHNARVGNIPSVFKIDSDVCIFSSDAIAVPVCYEEHWFLVVVLCPLVSLYNATPEPIRQKIIMNRRRVRPTVDHRRERVTQYYDPGASEREQRLQQAEKSAADVEVVCISDSDDEGDNVSTSNKIQKGDDADGIEDCLVVERDTANLSFFERQRSEADSVHQTGSKSNAEVPNLFLTQEALTSNHSMDRTHILVLDSLGTRHATSDVISPILNFLVQRYHMELCFMMSEMSVMKTSDLSMIATALHRLDVEHIALPQQPNGCDCGYFMLHNLEIFREDRALDALINDPKKWVRPARRSQSLYTPKQAIDKRQYLLAIFQELSAGIERNKQSTEDNRLSVDDLVRTMQRDEQVVYALNEIDRLRAKIRQQQSKRGRSQIEQQSDDEDDELP